MKTGTLVLTVAAAACVLAGALSAFGQEYRNLEVGPVEKIQTITAGPDGTAWGLTSTSRLFFCKAVNSPAPHIACYDEKGLIKANFTR